ncbi:MAG: four helix bundle protein [Gemmatimonadales bacterium]
MERYERFAPWKAAHQLALTVYGHTRSWPSDERYGMTSQVRRAAVSVAANIVEGSARRGSKEFRRYLDISFASLAEVGYFLRLARDLHYETLEDWERVEAQRIDTVKAIWSLMQRLNARQ